MSYAWVDGPGLFTTANTFESSIRPERPVLGDDEVCLGDYCRSVFGAETGRNPRGLALRRKDERVLFRAPFQRGHGAFEPNRAGGRELLDGINGEGLLRGAAS